MTAAWRTSSAEALEEAAKRVEAAGIQGEWFDGPRDRPRLPLHRPVGPHADPALGRQRVPRHRGRRRVDLPRPPQPPQQGRRRPAPARPRHDRDERRRRVRGLVHRRARLPHHGQDVLDEAPISVFSVLTTNEKSHDLGVVLDGSTRAGRVNHYAFWVDTREELLIAADVLDGERLPDRVRPVDPRHRRAELPLLPRALEPAHRAEHRRLPQLRAGLGAQHLAARRRARTTSTATARCRCR